MKLRVTEFDKNHVCKVRSDQNFQMSRTLSNLQSVHQQRISLRSSLFGTGKTHYDHFTVIKWSSYNHLNILWSSYNHNWLSYNHLTIILQSLYNHQMIIVPSYYNHCTVTKWSSYNHLNIILPSFYHHLTIILPSSYHHITIILPSYYYHRTITNDHTIILAS